MYSYKETFLDTLISLRNDNVTSNSLLMKDKNITGPTGFTVESCDLFPLFRLFDSNLDNSLAIVYNEYSDSYTLRICLNQEAADVAFF